MAIVFLLSIRLPISITLRVVIGLVYGEAFLLHESLAWWESEAKAYE